MNQIRHVIWDFNGTLLDDVDCCVATLNTLLDERKLAQVTRASYLARFGFPVQDFYRALGFDFERESFDLVSSTFISRYTERIELALPCSGAELALAENQRRAIGQSVVSAMEQNMLDRLLLRFGLARHMTHVRGLDHHNATSKVQLGLALRHELGVRPEQLLLVGDTLHDYETATAIGCHCLLYAGGHQSAERLARSGAQLIESLAEVAAFIDHHGQSTT
jgi:phosphoglycolate phosphatase